MLFDLTSILSALNLVESIVKPLPVVGGILGGVIGTADGVLNSTLGTVDSTLSGILGGILLENVTDTNAASSATDIPSSILSNLTCAVQPYVLLTPITVEPFAPYNASQAMVYRYRQQQAVNLGSWFVQEQWMNPSLFTCASGPAQAELDVASGWGSVDNARQVLERHWDEWITEDDFKYLASIGRFPIAD